MNLFDFLNEDELSNVAYFATSVLRSNPWNMDPPEDSMLLLSDKRGPFSRLRRKLFRIVGVNNIRGRHGDVLMNGHNAISGKTLKRLEGLVSVIYLCDAPRINCRVHVDLYNALIAHGRVLKTVVLELHSPTAPLRDLVAGLGCELEELSIELRGPAITALGELTLPVDISFPRLKSVALKGFVNLDVLTSLLPKCCGILEDLFLQDAQYSRNDIGTTSDWSTIITTIRVHCRAIRDVRLFGKELPTDSYFLLLLSYGPQLRRADLKHFWCNPVVCMELVKHCPNVRFNMKERIEMLEVVGMLPVVSPYVEELELAGGNVITEAVETMATKCVNLTRFHWVSEVARNVDVPGSFFLEPRYPLRSLSLSMRKLQLHADALQSILTCVSDLRELELYVGRLEDKDELCHSFRLCPKLMNVCLWQSEGVTEVHALDFSLSFIESFRDHALLKNLTVSFAVNHGKLFKEVITSACEYLRLRRVNVAVCGIRNLVFE